MGIRALARTPSGSAQTLCLVVTRRRVDDRRQCSAIQPRCGRSGVGEHHAGPSEKAIYTATQKQMWEFHLGSRVQWERVVAVSGELADQRAEIAHLQTSLDSLVKSRSWRIAAPLRWLSTKAHALGLR